MRETGSEKSEAGASYLRRMKELSSEPSLDVMKAVRVRMTPQSLLMRPERANQ